MNFAFHRLARSWPKYRWFKPLLTGLIAIVFYVLLSVLVSLGFFAVSLIDPQGFGAGFERLVFETVIDNSDPLVLAYSLVVVALMLPALLLATLIMGPRPLGLLSSVVGRLRWHWMGRLLLPALGAFAASYVLYLLVLPLIAGDPLVAPQVGASTWVMLAVTLLLVPLQATAEEYVFRGYLMQTIGGWLKHPAWAILLPVPLFMAGHLYDVWGLLDVGVFALFAGWITWRTGGLEAAIMAHVINNASIFALGAFGMVDVNAAEGSPWGVLVTALTLGLYAWLVLRMSGGIHRERRLVLPAAPTVPPPMQGYAQDE
ncbi:CAAX prenyl protease-like protein [Homoserinimonas aerilata]|uniref:CAAX prenyl protease-like protein n=1 Tax=Homoserinimonas aerilata TaxID=1162970 RepID=A0A542XX87_9MICO|nr:type II CAAX endopeptidase family protein [Homoserinimonas aerilata]TQL40451.1 CAAX prenyl protease-like protein [Homoserinimonas aerilata]